MDAHAGKRVAVCANRVASWLGMRDITGLSRSSLQEEVGVPNGVVDLFVLFGGGVLGSVDVLAHAMRQRIARKYAVVGGRGHATYGLSNAVGELLHQEADAGKSLSLGFLDPSTASEAEMISAVLNMRFGLAPDLLETRSTNCGNNIEFLLDLLDEEPEAPGSVVLCQDATMQRRMDATWRRQVVDRPRYANCRIINWASYATSLLWTEDGLCYKNSPEGMWDVRRYLSLLIGDVSRLVDDEHGYGPCGADYVVHVDVPTEVHEAWCELCELCPGDQRLRC